MTRAETRRKLDALRGRQYICGTSPELEAAIGTLTVDLMLDRHDPDPPEPCDEPDLNGGPSCERCGWEPAATCECDEHPADFGRDAENQEDFRDA